MAHQPLLAVTDRGPEFGSQAKNKLVGHDGLFFRPELEEWNYSRNATGEGTLNKKI